MLAPMRSGGQERDSDSARCLLLWEVGLCVFLSFLVGRPAQIFVLFEWQRRIDPKFFWVSCVVVKVDGDPRSFRVLGGRFFEYDLVGVSVVDGVLDLGWLHRAIVLP